MKVLCLEDVLKAIAVSEKTSKTGLSFCQKMESLIQSGSAELCGVMNKDFSCMLILQRGVFEDLVRNTIVNASLPLLSMEEEVSWCGEPFQLLVLVSCFTPCEKSINALEYRRKLQKGLLPTIEKLFSEEMLFFNKTMLLLTLQRPSVRVQI